VGHEPRLIGVVQLAKHLTTKGLGRKKKNLLKTLPVKGAQCDTSVPPPSQMLSCLATGPISDRIREARGITSFENPSVSEERPDGISETSAMSSFPHTTGGCSEKQTSRRDPPWPEENHFGS
jgi:hypothetical protein